MDPFSPHITVYLDDNAYNNVLRIMLCPEDKFMFAHDTTMPSTRVSHLCTYGKKCFTSEREVRTRISCWSVNNYFNTPVLR